MSTVAEIETAIRKLPTEQLLEIAAWLDEQRAALGAAESVFRELDAEEGENAGKQWLGE